MVLFSLCFGVLKVKNTHAHQVFKVFDLCTKMAVTHLTIDEVVHQTMMELKATNKTCLERKGMLRLTQMMRMVLVATVIIKKKY